MQKCGYCGKENEESLERCAECGTPLAEKFEPIGLVTPHRMAREIQISIWQRIALQQRRIYTAGFLIGALGGLIGSLYEANPLSIVWSVPACGIFGLGAVWLLVFMEKLQARINQAQAEGNPTGSLKILFVLLGLFGLLAVVFVIGLIVSYFL